MAIGEPHDVVENGRSISPLRTRLDDDRNTAFPAARRRSGNGILPPLMTRIPDPSCDARGEGSEIVVCGGQERRQRAEQRRQRLTLPGERGPREGPRQALGELNQDPGEPCPIRGCSTGIDFQAIGNAIEAIFGSDD
ncbi:hypothetical protein CLG96_10900 [Sphingomonas oleivorans]|uniref:Uncharacterized protein n=1 Tax=Sphingomonas oleivorans TaxID=1735121 RepID=A0A2T5FXP9_9SPHN|nr:hypothetical protein [Sphingomonas oleivorans]PTQ10886.1 hypothetical protein CLG96_10900 [Sphingomonas oleivorans]